MERATPAETPPAPPPSISWRRIARTILGILVIAFVCLTLKIAEEPLLRIFIATLFAYPCAAFVYQKVLDRDALGREQDTILWGLSLQTGSLYYFLFVCAVWGACLALYLSLQIVRQDSSAITLSFMSFLWISALILVSIACEPARQLLDIIPRLYLGPDRVIIQRIFRRASYPLENVQWLVIEDSRGSIRGIELQLPARKICIPLASCSLADRDRITAFIARLQQEHRPIRTAVSDFATPTGLALCSLLFTICACIACILFSFWLGTILNFWVNWLTVGWPSIDSCFFAPMTGLLCALLVMAWVLQYRLRSINHYLFQRRKTPGILVSICNAWQEINNISFISLTGTLQFSKERLLLSGGKSTGIFTPDQLEELELATPNRNPLHIFEHPVGSRPIRLIWRDERNHLHNVTLSARNTPALFEALQAWRSGTLPDLAQDQYSAPSSLKVAGIVCLILLVLFAPKIHLDLINSKVRTGVWSPPARLHSNSLMAVPFLNLNSANPDSVVVLDTTSSQAPINNCWRFDIPSNRFRVLPPLRFIGIANSPGPVTHVFSQTWLESVLFGLALLSPYNQANWATLTSFRDGHSLIFARTLLPDTSRTILPDTRGTVVALYAVSELLIEKSEKIISGPKIDEESLPPGLVGIGATFHADAQTSASAPTPLSDVELGWIDLATQQYGPLGSAQTSLRSSQGCFLPGGRKAVYRGLLIDLDTKQIRPIEGASKALNDAMSGAIGTIAIPSGDGLRLVAQRFFRTFDLG